MTRKQSRDEAFKLLYQLEVQKESAEYILDIFYGENNDVDEKARLYISNVLFGFEMNKEAIDAAVKRYSRGWSIDRISKLSVAGLRLAIFEIMFCDDIPDTVAASEAVSLVKLYDSEDSAGFVNGILASVIGGKGIDNNGKQSE